MFAPEKLLHMTHVAADVPTRLALEKWYLEVFGAQTYYEARPVEGLDRDETLILIGELCLIPQCSTNLNSEQGKLRASFAGRFAQMAIKIPEVESQDAHFRQHGITPICLHPAYKKIFFMTDPKETVGVRYELCAVDMPNDLRLRPGWSANWWRDSHPLGIEKIASIATATDDLAKATKFYREAWGLDYLGQREVPEESAMAAAFKIGSKSPFVLEVMAPAGKGTPLSDYVAKHGGGIYSVNFKVKSLAGAADYLKSKGLRLVGEPKRRFSIDPRDSFGVTFTMVDRDVQTDG
jgi:methylmalonyl-CoA/ethylmalonyl-CoA epimerase